MSSKEFSKALMALKRDILENDPYADHMSVRQQHYSSGGGGNIINVTYRVAAPAVEHFTPSLYHWVHDQFEKTIQDHHVYNPSLHIIFRDEDGALLRPTGAEEWLR